MSDARANRVVLTGTGLTVTVAPTGGARIVQLTDWAGHDWLVETDREDPEPNESIDFIDGVRGGWDECLPSVSACVDPNRGGYSIPDHGDFWFRPWQVVACSNVRVVLDAPAPDPRLRVRKTVRLVSDRAACAVTMAIHNRGDAEYRLVYSAHPLWRWNDTARLELPDAGAVRTAFGRAWPQPRVGSWPEVDGQDLSAVVRTGEPDNYKVFVRWSGEARFSVADQTRALRLTQSGHPMPWLGVCVNRDSWPEQQPGESWIALEPTTSPTDSLAEAVAAGTELRLPADGSIRWTSTIKIEPAATRR